MRTAQPDSNDVGGTPGRSAMRPQRAHTIRVCMVSYYFEPDYSGSSIQAHNLSRYLQRLGVEPLIVSANLSGSPSRAMKAGVPVFRLPVARSASLQVPSFWLSLSVFLVRRRSTIDVVHAHGGLQHGIASIAGSAAGCKTILKVAMADSDLAFGRQGRLWGAVNRFLARRFHAYIATTDAIKAEFSLHGLDAAKVRHIPNGVDTEVHSPVDPSRRQALRRELGLPAGPVVCYLGIVNERKNVDGLLRIWQRTRRLGVDGHLLVVGPAPGGDTNPYYRRLTDFVGQCEMGGSVSFVGQRPDAGRLLQASDIFVFPSRQEGMPNAVLEAMATGLPCVVSRGTGSDGVVVDGHTGYAREVCDEDGFAQTVAELMRDETRRVDIGREARRQIVQHLSLEVIAGRYLNLYRELLGRTTADVAVVPDEQPVRVHSAAPPRAADRPPIRG